MTSSVIATYTFSPVTTHLLPDTDQTTIPGPSARYGDKSVHRIKL